MRGLRLVAPLSLGVVLVLSSACVGSRDTYRPYKGEPRPDQETRVDPLLTEDELKHSLPHEIDQNSTYLEMSRKENTSVLEHVHRNPDGSNRNAWRAYEKDMVGTLGPGSLPRVAPDPSKKPDKPGKDAPSGDDAPKPAGDKPDGDKPAGDKPDGDKPAADKPAMGG